jgi:hypothetical protein
MYADDGFVTTSNQQFYHRLVQKVGKHPSTNVCSTLFDFVFHIVDR